MSLPHAIVWTDHHSAHVLQFDAGRVESKTVRDHTHPTAQHGSGVRSEHEFFGQVCDAIGGIGEILLVGGHTAIADFRHYADKHRPHDATRIVGYEVCDHLSDNQLLARGRAFFAERLRLGK
jgi:hypothetical protein